MSKVYKVVRVGVAGRFYSGFVDGPRKVTYRVGKEAFPTEGTKLFAFKSLYQAKRYARLWGKANKVVFVAEAKNARLNGWLDNLVSNLKELRWLFSEGKHRMPRPCPEFDSACVCDSIKLIKKVEDTHE